MPDGRGRVLGVDVGTVRTGLAVSDPDRMVATPLVTLSSPAEPVAHAAALMALAAEHQAIGLVVGLPRALSGRETASTAQARAVAEALEAAGRQVWLWDERLSSVEAERSLIRAGRSRRQRTSARDQVAATIILQGWLDAQRHAGTRTGGE